MFLYGIAAAFYQIVQWIIILIAGVRIKTINQIIIDYIKYQIQVVTYLNYVTDERPGKPYL